MKTNYPRVSVITVNFNGKKYLKTLFDSLFKLKYPNSKIDFIFVDNASNDDSVSFVKTNYSKVKVIKNSVNNYCRAINLGIAAAKKAEYVALVNNDTRMDKDWLAELVKVISEDHSIGAVGSKILDMKGRVQNASHCELPDFYWGERGAGQKANKYKNIEEIPSLCGASVLYRKCVFSEIGLFDEDFVIYGEDVDMAFRLRQKGYKLMFVPKSVIYHQFHGTATEDFARYYIERNRLLFLAKHYPHKLSSSLVGSGYFTSKNSMTSFGKLSSVFPDIIMKLIKNQPIDIINEVVKELISEISKISNYENNILIREMNKITDDRNGVHQRLAEKEEYAETKERLLNEKQREFILLKEEFDNISNQLRQRMEDVLAKEGQILEKGVHISRLKEELDNISNQLRQRMEEVLAKEGQVLEKDNYISRLKEELGNVSDQLRQRMDDVLMKEGHMLEKDSHIFRLKEELDNMRKKIEEALVKEGQIMEKDVYIAKLKEEFDNISNQLRQRMDDVLIKEGQLLEKSNYISGLKEELDNISNQLRQRMDDVLMKEGQILEKDNYISGLIEELDNISNQLRQREGQMLEKDNDMFRLKEELDNISNQLRQRMDDVLIKEGQILEKDVHIARLKEEFNNISNQLRQRIEEALIKEEQIFSLKSELSGIYNSTGFRFVLKPMWILVWNIRELFKAIFRKTLRQVLWFATNIMLIPVFIFLDLCFLIEHISWGIFGPLFKVFAPNRKIKQIKDGEVSLVMPNYNGIDCLRECLPSIFSADGFSDGQNEVLIVDDGSTDGSVDFIKANFPQVRLILNRKNRGFGFTCNRGVRSAKNEIVVLINNDIILTRDFLKPLISHFQKEDVFAVTPKMYAWDKKTFVWGMHMGRFENGYIRLWNEAETGNGDRISQFSPTIFAIGGAMAFRKSDFLWLGGFDSIYKPNCWEDIDISYRAWKRGLKVLYEPKSLMYHKGRATLTYERPKEIKNELLFTWKNITNLDILKNHLRLLPWNLYSYRMNFFTGFLWALNYLPQMFAHRFLERRYLEIDDKKIFDYCMHYYRNFMRRGFKHLENNERRNVLIITPFMPYPLNAGGKIRIHNLAKLLKNDFNISLLTLIDREEETSHTSQLKKVFKEVYMVFPKTEIESRLYPKRYKYAHSHALIDKLNEIQKDQPIDLIHIESNELLYLTNHIKHIPVIYTEHDASVLFFKDSYYQIKEGTVFSNFLDYLKRVRLHCAMYKKLDKIVLLSREDKGILKSFFPKANFSYIPTGVDTELFSFIHPESKKTKRLIYVGHYPHYPNEDAVVYFINKIFPYIRKNIPDVEFLIVGSGATENIKRLANHPNVRLIGEVENVWQYLKESAVFVNPIRISAGIKGKVLEAMSTGIPVVSTISGSSGINAEDGREILIADTPLEFAQAVTALFKDNALYSNISRNARALAEKEYDWNRISQLLIQAYDQAMDISTPLLNRKEASLDNIIDSSNKIIEEAIHGQISCISSENSPEELHLELTYKCNASCIMCDLWDAHDRTGERKKELSLEEIKQFVDRSEKLKNIKTVVLSGGEPFLRKDLSDICGYFIKRFPNVSMGILTNGINTENIIKTTQQIMKKYKPKYLWLGSSLDGIGSAHDKVRAKKGAFASLEKTIHACKREGIDITLTFTLTSNNFDQLIPARKFADSYGVGLYIQFVVPKDTREKSVFNFTQAQMKVIEDDIRKIIELELQGKNYSNILRSMRDDSYQGLVAKLYYLSNLTKYQRSPKRYFRKCVAGSKFAMLSPSGDLYFCPGLKNGSIGNIREDSFDNLWASKKAGSVKEFINQELCHCWLVCIVFPAIDQARLSLKNPKTIEASVKTMENKFEEFDFSRENKILSEKNSCLNEQEYRSGKIDLESTPQGIGIGAHSKCDAECVFCLGGYPRLFDIKTYHQFFEKRLANALPKADFINLCGFGELLLMPRCEEFLAYLNKGLPFSNKIITTNGTPLSRTINQRLSEGRYSIQISLHASENRLHKFLTHTESFDRIIHQTEELLTIRKTKDNPSVNLVFVANTMNIENLPDFVKFAGKLGVDSVSVNYMTVYNPSHLKLSCFFKQRISARMFSEAEEISAKLGISLGLPPKFGTNGNGSKYPKCSDPWKYLYVETEGSMLPCCHAGSHIGYLYRDDFQDVWNGDFYKNLRKSLVEGKAEGWCKYCYKNKPSNVNDIRSHVSFRPDLQQKILKGLV